MKTPIEIQIDPNCLISAEVEKVDNSYDDAIGRVRCFQYEISNFQLTVWIDGIDYNLTEGLKLNDREMFIEILLSKARKELSSFSDD